MFRVRVHEPTSPSNSPRPATGRRRLASLLCLGLALVACSPAEPPAGDAAIVGLESTTYVNDSVTFTVAVVGGAYDSLELRRDGAKVDRFA